MFQWRGHSVMHCQQFHAKYGNIISLTRTLLCHAWIMVEILLCSPQHWCTSHIMNFIILSPEWPHLATSHDWCHAVTHGHADRTDSVISLADAGGKDDFTEGQKCGPTRLTFLWFAQTVTSRACYEFTCFTTTYPHSRICSCKPTSYSHTLA